MLAVVVVGGGGLACRACSGGTPVKPWMGVEEDEVAGQVGREGWSSTIYYKHLYIDQMYLTNV